SAEGVGDRTAAAGPSEKSLRDGLVEERRGGKPVAPAMGQGKRDLRRGASASARRRGAEASGRAAPIWSGAAIIRAGGSEAGPSPSRGADRSGLISGANGPVLIHLPALPPAPLDEMVREDRKTHGDQAGQRPQLDLVHVILGLLQVV